jgi:hypothetical protein
MYIPLPMFVLRRIVRKNPWLLGENGFTRRTCTLDLGLCELEVEAEGVLGPKEKAKLQAEASAGKLFG